MRAIALACGLALTACSFDPPPDVGDDGGGAIDAAGDPIDGAFDCVPDSVVCNDATDHYVECSSGGTPALEMDCPLGCSDTAEKCVDVDPSNGVAQYLDQAATDPNAPDLSLADGSTIDTDSGIVFNAGVSVTVPNAVVGTTRVFMVKSLSITGSVVVSGSASLIIVSDGDVGISATVDLSGNGGTSGPGGGAGSCAGVNSTTAGAISGGGGGAGNGDPGANGGAGDNGGGPGGPGGAALSSTTLEPLRGGCEGGRATEGGSTCTSGLGGGGGGMQITSRTQIAVTASGVIDASGGGGRPAVAGTETCTSTSLRGGGGGGSGGSILLEAPQVLLDGAGVIVSTNGGSGSAGGVGQLLAGNDGGTQAGAALGGVNPTTGANGGPGGTATLTPGQGTVGDTNEDGGGGGGAVGRVRFNTTAGVVNPINGAVIRSKSSSGNLRTRLVP